MRQHPALLRFLQHNTHVDRCGGAAFPLHLPFLPAELSHHLMSALRCLINHTFCQTFSESVVAHVSTAFPPCAPTCAPTDELIHDHTAAAAAGDSTLAPRLLYSVYKVICKLCHHFRSGRLSLGLRLS